MKWWLLTNYQCPKCEHRLKYVRVRKVFVCFCGFVIRYDKRKEIAAKYPHVPHRDIQPYLEEIITID